MLSRWAPCPRTKEPDLEIILQMEGSEDSGWASRARSRVELRQRPVIWVEILPCGLNRLGTLSEQTAAGFPRRRESPTNPKLTAGPGTV